MAIPLIAIAAVQAGIAIAQGIGAAVEGDRVRDANAQEMARAKAMERRNAAAVTAQGALAIGRMNARANQARSQARVMAAQAGLASTSGTLAGLDASMEVASEAEAENIRLQAAQRAFGHTENARSYTARIAADKLAGQAQGAQIGVQTGANVFSSFLGAIK